MYKQYDKILKINKKQVHFAAYARQNDENKKQFL